MCRAYAMARERSIAIASAYLGWVMDGYDALLVAPILPLLGSVFFPGPYSYLGGLSTLVATLVMRPLGSVVMGYVGDWAGRRVGLMATTLGYSLSGLAIALMPPYESAGAAAPIAVLALRALQGVFLGGEWGPGTSMIMEWSGWRGEISSAFAQTGYPLGALAASLVYSAMSASMGSAFAAFGWRIYIATGALAAILAFMLRRRSVESPLWRRPRRNPLAALFLESSADLAKAIAMTTGLFLIYYSTYLIYSQYLKYVGLAELTPLVMTASTAAAVISVFLGGVLALVAGYRAVFVGSLVAALAFAPYALMFNPSAGSLVALAFLENFAMGLVPLVLVRRFGVEKRATGLGVAYNWGLLIGGWAPLLVGIFGSMTVGMVSVMAVGVVMAIAGLLALGSPTP
jgi:hypothetical protein